MLEGATAAAAAASGWAGVSAMAISFAVVRPFRGVPPRPAEPSRPRSRSAPRAPPGRPWNVWIRRGLADGRCTRSLLLVFARLRLAARSLLDSDACARNPPRFPWFGRRGPMAERKRTVAVVGATGAVGEVVLQLLAERQFPVGELR